MGLIKNLFDKFLQRKAQTPEVTIPSSMYVKYFEAGKVSPNNALLFYRENSALATVIDLMGAAVEQMEPVLDIDNELVNEHPLLELLKTPNGFETWDEIAGKAERYLKLTGNVYYVTVGNYKFEPIELYVINPSKVDAVANIDGKPESYFLSNTQYDGKFSRIVQRGDITRFIRDNLTELFHTMLFSSSIEEITGDSPLNSIYYELKSISEGARFNYNMINNGARPSLWINYKDGVNSDEVAHRKKLFKEQMSGPNNAGGVMMTSSDEENKTGPDIMKLHETNKDMDFAELQKRSDYTIYKRYQVELALLSLEASTYNNMEQATLNFYNKVVIPDAEKLFSGLTRFLIPKYGDLKNKNVKITYDPYKVRPLLLDLFNELKTRKEIGLETVNELRTMIPERDEIENGDVVLVPSSAQSLDDVSIEEPAEVDFNQIIEQDEEEEE